MEKDRPDPREFYDSYGRDEWHRLETGIDGSLEFEATTATLREQLPADGQVLDAGGGAGRYAVWLAERGYEVTLIDLSKRQTELAREYAAENGVSEAVSVVRGSITDLGADDGSFDATCCLGGPLSHLLEEQQRTRAARELQRVTVPDGPVFASVIGLLGFLQLYLATGYQLELLPDLLDHGNYDGRLLTKYDDEQPFTDTHLFRKDELKALLSKGGLTVEEVVGLEGLGSLFHDATIRKNVAELSTAELGALKDVVRETNDDPVVTDLSIHMLAVSRA